MDLVKIRGAFVNESFTTFREGLFDSATTSSENEVIKAIWDMMREFTRRNLTHKENTHMAIAGLVQLYTEVVGIGFFRGIPSNAFARLLAWSNDFEGSQKHNRKAPTWSWFAYNGPVFPPEQGTSAIAPVSAIRLNVSAQSGWFVSPSTSQQLSHMLYLISLTRCGLNSPRIFTYYSGRIQPSFVPTRCVRNLSLPSLLTQCLAHSNR